MSAADDGDRPDNEDRYGAKDPQPDVPEQRAEPAGPADASVGATADLPPERKPWNTSGYIGLALCAVSFSGSVLVGWSGAVLMAALGLALCLTGIVRVYRGRATNRFAVLAGIGLAVVTFVLQFVWAARAEPCVSLRGDADRYVECYNEHAGIL